MNKLGYVYSGSQGTELAIWGAISPAELRDAAPVGSVASPQK